MKKLFFILFIIGSISIFARSGYAFENASGISDPKQWEKKLEISIYKILEGSQDIKVEATAKKDKLGEFSFVKVEAEQTYSFVHISELLGEGMTFPEKVLQTDIYGLKADKMIAEFADLKVNAEKLWDEGEIKTKSIAEVKLYLRISQGNLEDLLRSKNKHISDLKVEMRGGKIYLSGMIPVTGRIAIKLSINGRLEIDDKGRIQVIDYEIFANDSRVPSLIANTLVRLVNPLLDLREIPFRLDLKTIDIQDKEIIISS